MFRFLSKMCDVLDSIFTYASCVLLLLVIIASSLQVFTRYVLNASMTGTEEFARFSFIWMSMLGCSVAVGRAAHPTITLIVDRMKGIYKKILIVGISILISLCALIWIVYGIEMVSVTTAMRSPILLVPMAYVYLAIPVGGLGILLHCIQQIIYIFAVPVHGTEGV
jgi:TRAP-type C4-dicarboxylate transport system permease small subunit